LAIVSLLIAGTLLVYWWRSNHKHVDTFTLGTDASTRTTFTTGPGVVWVKVIEAPRAGSATQPTLIVDDMRPYPFKNILGYFLLIPGLWLAIKIRNFLPRPPGRELSNREPPNGGLKSARQNKRRT
jgi:hypothetical protein